MKKERNLAEYISGFVDGEGCFMVSFSKRPKFLVGWETKPSFSVGQNHDRAEVLLEMQEYFRAGYMRDDFGGKNKMLKYEVRRLDDLIEKIIPHFEAFPLLSGKQRDFELLKEICLRMKCGAHITPKGLREIVTLAYQMNSSGRRRYTQADILVPITSDEDIVSAATKVRSKHEVQTCTNGVTSGQLSRGGAR